MFKTIAASVFALVVFFLSALTQAAPTQVDKCAPGPGKLRQQCAIELGGYCNPQTGRWRRTGGVIRGVARLEECVERKRRELRRSS